MLYALESSASVIPGTWRFLFVVAVGLTVCEPVAHCHILARGRQDKRHKEVGKWNQTKTFAGVGVSRHQQTSFSAYSSIYMCFDTAVQTQDNFVETRVTRDKNVYQYVTALHCRRLTIAAQATYSRKPATRLNCATACHWLRAALLSGVMSVPNATVET